MMQAKRQRRRIRCSRVTFWFDRERPTLTTQTANNSRRSGVRDRRPGATYFYTTGTRLAASIAGEITSMSSGTCQRLVSRTSGGALPAFAPSSTKPS